MKFKINILTYLYIILALLSGLFKNTVAFLIVIIFHELGHLIIIKWLGYNINHLIIYPFGGIIKINKIINTKIIDDILISIGGLLGQLLLLITCYITKPYLNEYLINLLIIYNKFIFIINIIPIYPFDGFWLLNHLLNYFFSYYWSYIISLIINILSILFLILYLLFNRILNIPIYIVFLFSIIYLVNNYQKFITKFYIERLYYDFYYRHIRYLKKPCKYLIKREELSYFHHRNEKDIIKTVH